MHISYQGEHLLPALPTDIPLDKIALSNKIYLPINKVTVKNIIDSMRLRFDPSYLRLVLFPANEASFNTKDIRSNSYHVVQGCHTLLALKALDEKGELTSLPGLHLKKIPSIIINTTDPALLNYGNSRANDLSAQFAKKPQIQDLIYVFESLQKHYDDTARALEVIIRYAKSLKFGAEDITALRKLSLWPTGLWQQYCNYITPV